MTPGARKGEGDGRLGEGERRKEGQNMIKTEKGKGGILHRDVWLLRN